MGSIKIIDGNTISDTDPLQIAMAASEGHLGEVGGRIAVSSVSFTRPADSTAYAANDVVSDSTTTTTMQPIAVARATDKTGYVVGVRLSTNKKSITPRFRVHLFHNTGATLSGDNAAYQSLYGDDSKKIGSVDLAAMATPTDTANSDFSAVADFTMRIPFVPKSGTSNIYAVLETLDAFTPATGQSFTLTLWTDNN